MIRVLPTSLRQRARERRTAVGRRAWSQEGEDLILARYFESVPRGFFVDVGAHHPFRFSNTCLLYKQGWRGVNIDAMPGSMGPFRRARPRDINLEIGIGTQTGIAHYFVFNEPALNTFDPELAARQNVGPWRIVAQIELPVRPPVQPDPGR